MVGERAEEGEAPSCNAGVGSSSEERFASSSQESATGCLAGFFGFDVEEVDVAVGGDRAVGRGMSRTGPFSPMERLRSAD